MRDFREGRARLNWSIRFTALAAAVFLAAGCAQVSAPDGRSAEIPTVTPPLDRYKGVNEKRDAVTRVRLGRDVLVPQAIGEDPLPEEVVGPYELRGESLASALQLVIDDYDISLAFQSDRAMTQRITVANLRGKVGDVIDRMCELADLYCHFEHGILTVKDTETFVVDLPPLASSTSSGSSSSSTSSSSATSSSSSGSSSSSDSSAYDQIVTGLQAITGTVPTVDTTTRVMIYTATQRTHKSATRYFERLRKNTALIIYETHIWEVSLENNNRTGINWEALFSNVGNFDINVEMPGAAPTGAAGAASPISITPTYTGSGDVTSEAVLEFISEQGNVRTVSQPQLTVLSGSSAALTVQQSENFVSGISRTPSTVVGTPDTVSTTTDTVETGLAMNITSAWDQATVYGTISIELDELLDIDEFNPDANTLIQLPRTTSRNLQTQIRVRPGDAVLIAGLVTERDDYSASGPGLMKPLFQTARSAETRNTELVFLLRPRVVVFEPGTQDDTVVVVEAPKEGYRPASVTDEVGEIFAPVARKPALPVGISAEALAPISAEPMPTVVEEVAPVISDVEEPLAYQEEQVPDLPVPAHVMQPQVPAEQQHAMVQDTPVSLTTPTDTPSPQAEHQQGSGLPSWLPSQGGVMPSSVHGGGQP